MENRSHVIAAVIFILVLGGGTAVAYFWLVTGDDATRTIEIRTDLSVSGVSIGTPVMYKGLKVGHVDEVGFAPDNAHLVRIIIKIRPSIPLNTSSYAQLSSQGITGLSNITLHTPDSTATTLGREHDHLPTLSLHPGLLDTLENHGKAILAKANTILDQLQTLTGQDNIRHISRILAQMDQATHQLTQVEEQLHPVLARMPQLTEHIDKTLGDAQKLMQQARPAIGQIQKAAHTATRLGQSGDEVMQNLNRRLLPQIEKLSQQLRDTARRIDKLTTELSAQPQSLLTGPPERRPGPGEPGFESPAK